MVVFGVIVILLIFVCDAQYAIFAYADRASFWAQFSGALVLVITVLTIVLYHIMSRYAQEAAQKQQLEMQIRQEKQHIEELNQVSESLHMLRHDMRNHLSIAADLMAQGETAEGSRYLNSIESHILHIFSTGCPALDSALYLKQSEMQHRGITLVTDIMQLKVLPITTYDLCSLVTNLLDNAAEARERFPEPPEDYTVELSIRRHRDMLYMECSNPVWEPSVKKEGERFVSSKTEPDHGKGIPAMEKMMERLNASCDFAVADGHFRAILAIPYLEEIDVNLPHEEAVRMGLASSGKFARKVRIARWKQFFRRRF